MPAQYPAANIPSFSATPKTPPQLVGLPVVQPSPPARSERRFLLGMHVATRLGGLFPTATQPDPPIKWHLPMKFLMKKYQQPRTLGSLSVLEPYSLSFRTEGHRLLRSRQRTQNQSKKRQKPLKWRSIILVSVHQAHSVHLRNCPGEFR
jgi:hypothetical protein